ncbi:hypothetical protein C1H46_043668 [Malus baccata]|uniref:Uncharacterized protein n=1 Tax=Malus baccata TaxID=106549 RepID=A0A540K990_MALBA|nr:hypothetical protein C1H46_043668 [Malus baccata]
MAPLFPNARRQLFSNTNEPLVPAIDHEVIGSMMPTPTNNTATPVLTQENLVSVLTANMKILIFGGEWNDFLHASNMPVYPPQSPNPLINIYCPRYDGAVKNVLLKDEHFPSDLPGVSYRFDPIEICNVVHFDSNFDCTSTARTRHPKKSYKAIKECAACEYVGGQEHCDWMNCATCKAKQEAIPIQIQSAKSPSNDVYGKNS